MIRWIGDLFFQMESIANRDHPKATGVRYDTSGFFLCLVSDDGVINESLITQTYGADSRPPFPPVL